MVSDPVSVAVAVPLGTMDEVQSSSVVNCNANSSTEEAQQTAESAPIVVRAQVLNALSNPVVDEVADEVYDHRPLRLDEVDAGFVQVSNLPDSASSRDLPAAEPDPGPESAKKQEKYAFFLLVAGFIIVGLILGAFFLPGSKSDSEPISAPTSTSTPPTFSPSFLPTAPPTRRIEYRPGSSGLCQEPACKTLRYKIFLNKATNAVFQASGLTDISGLLNDVDIGPVNGAQIRSWDVSRVTRMADTFTNTDFTYYNANFRLDTWNVSSVTDMEGMFRDTFGFHSYLANWETGRVKNMKHMFHGAVKASVAGLNNWDTSQVTHMGSMFAKTDMKSLDLSGWSTSQVTSMVSMFRESQLQTLRQDWDTSGDTNMFGMFQNAANFDSFLGNFDVSNVPNMASMFQGAKSFTGQGLKGWNPSHATSMNRMFSGASAFNADLANWDVSAVTDYTEMFAGAYVFSQNLCSWKVSTNAITTDMFAQASKCPANNAALEHWNSMCYRC